MTYTVEILRTAQAQLAKIAKQDRNRIIIAIRAMAKVPMPHGCKSFRDVRLGELVSQTFPSVAILFHEVT